MSVLTVNETQNKSLCWLEHQLFNVCGYTNTCTWIEFEVHMKWQLRLLSNISENPGACMNRVTLMEAVGTFATLVYSCQTTQHHSSDDSGLHFLLELLCQRMLDFLSKYIFSKGLQMCMTLITVQKLNINVRSTNFYSHMLTPSLTFQGLEYQIHPSPHS